MRHASTRRFADPARRSARHTTTRSMRIVSWPRRRMFAGSASRSIASEARRARSGHDVDDACAWRAAATAPDGRMVDSARIEIAPTRCDLAARSERSRRLGFVRRRLRSFRRAASLTPRADTHWSASFGAGYSPPSLADQFFHEGVFVRREPEPSARARSSRGRGARDAARCERRGVFDVGGEARRVSSGHRRPDPLATELSIHLESVELRRSPQRVGVERPRRRAIDRRGSCAARSPVRCQLRRPSAQRAGRVPTALDGQRRGRFQRRGGARDSKITTRYIGTRRTVPAPG